MTEFSDTPLYNTAAVVQRAGVPATTIRAWERRYGYPKPQRDEAGQRLYSERDIQAIIWLADQTAHGVAISRAVNMVLGGHAAITSNHVTEPTAARTARSYDVLRSELEHALLAFDPGAADTVMNEAFALFSVEDVCLHILEPLLVEVGDRWHAGQMAIGEEHYVSSFIRARLFALLHAYERSGGDTPLVFTACAPSEWHEIGILLVSLFLARRGVHVRYLGPNLPLDGLADVVARHHPAVVVLSAQSHETARNLRTAGELLRRGRAPHPVLAIGGQAFNTQSALRTAVGGTYVGPDAETAAESIVQLLSRSTRSANGQTPAGAADRPWTSRSTRAARSRR